MVLVLEEHKGVHAMETIHNYNEKLVSALIREPEYRQGLSDDDLADVVCLALNNLPPRYIRYAIDYTFHLTDKAIYDMRHEVEDAVVDALTVVRSKRRSNRK